MLLFSKEKLCVFTVNLTLANMIICTVMPSCINFLTSSCFPYEHSILFFVTVTIKRRSVYKSLMKHQ